MDLIKDSYPEIRKNMYNISYGDWRAYLDKVVERYEKNREFALNFNCRLTEVIKCHEKALSGCCHFSRLTITSWKIVKYDEEFIEYTFDYQAAGANPHQFKDNFGQIPIEILEQSKLEAHVKKLTVDYKRKAKREHKKYARESFKDFLEKHPKEAKRIVDKHFAKEER